jgi:hypothetical protein
VRRLGLVTLAVGLLVVASCGDDDDGNGTGGAAATSGVGATGGAGGGSGGTTGGTGNTTGGTSNATGGTGGPSSDASGGTGIVDASDDAPAPAVVASAINTWVTDTGNVELAADLSTFDIAGLVYDASSNGFSTHPPTITGSGTFAFQELPAAEYYLRFNGLGGIPRYVVTSETNLDLGAFIIGRRGTTLAQAGTTLVFDVTNLAPWQATDTLELYSTGARTAIYALESKASSGTPVPDATQLSSLTVDYQEHGPNLIDGAKGDRAWLTQLVTRTLGASGTYLSLAKALELPAFSMANAQSTTLSGSLSNVTQATLGVDFKISQFEAALAAGNPSATLAFSHINLLAQHESSRSWLGLAPNLVIFYASSSNDLVASFSYGNPFPSAYGLMLQGLSVFSRSYTVGGATGNVDAALSLLTAPTASTTLAPSLGTVQNPKIADADALVARSGVGLRPKVSWSPPTLGTPTIYLLTVLRVFDSGGTLGRTMVGRVLTTKTEVVLPPGILAAGNSYVFRFSALARGAIDGARQPLLSALPESQADVLSGLVTP